jgi:hypothetical protein
MPVASYTYAEHECLTFHSQTTLLYYRSKHSAGAHSSARTPQSMQADGIIDITTAHRQVCYRDRHAHYHKCLTRNYFGMRRSYILPTHLASPGRVRPIDGMMHYRIPYFNAAIL